MEGSEIFYLRALDHLEFKTALIILLLLELILQESFKDKKIIVPLRVLYLQY